MTTETVLTEEQLVRQATDVLIDKLGIVEATRFLSLKHRQRIESVERHRKWQEGLDRDEFFGEVFQIRGEEKGDSDDKR
jgi:hypothetical protein